MDSTLAKRLSDAEEYPKVAGLALKEMLRQKGTTLRINGDGYAESGMLIRHLVLPGHIQNSLDVLRFIAEELSPLVHIGLMSQYYPSSRAFSDSNLSRTLTQKEYDLVVHAMEEFGITKGFVQELDSFSHYRPDFNKNHPFEQD
jgi:putative pyruvate formate lyase activating enzyme